LTPWDLILEILSAAGVAAEYCAREEIYGEFTRWVTLETSEPHPGPGDIERSHQILRQSPAVILALVQGMETELGNEEIMDQFRASLQDL
jgi:hypothetical protein